MLTTVCGLTSVGTLGYAFFAGAKHGYLVYSGILSAVLLRHQRATIRVLGEWLCEKYFLVKGVAVEYYYKKSGTPRARTEDRGKGGPEEGFEAVQDEDTVGALNQVGAASLANCLISGIAFGITSVGLFGDTE
jgi:hypothetical protein